MGRRHPLRGDLQQLLDLRRVHARDGIPLVDNGQVERPQRDEGGVQGDGGQRRRAKDEAVHLGDARVDVG